MKWLLVAFVVALLLLMYFQYATGHQYEGFRDGRRGGGSRTLSGGHRRPGGDGRRPGGGGHRPRHGRGGGGYYFGGSGYSGDWWPYGWGWWPYYDYLWFPSCGLTGCPDGYDCIEDPDTGYSYCI